MAKRKVNKKALLLLLLLFFTIIAVVGAVYVLTLEKDDGKNHLIASVIFTPYIVEGDEMTWSGARETFAYYQNNEATERYTSDVNISISESRYIIIEYRYINTSTKRLTGKVDFSGMTISNCEITCKNGDNEEFKEISLDQYSCSVAPNTSFTMSIMIKVENPALDSQFSGNLSLILNMG